MDERLNSMASGKPGETIRRRYDNQGNPLFVDARDFIDNAWLGQSRYYFTKEWSGGWRTYNFVLLEKHKTHVKIEVVITTTEGETEKEQKSLVYDIDSLWDGHEEELEAPSTLFTVQAKGKWGYFKQMNAATIAFNTFFGLCHCDVVKE